MKRAESTAHFSTLLMGLQEIFELAKFRRVPNQENVLNFLKIVKQDFSNDFYNLWKNLKVNL